jgi:hypothetical protein
MNAIAKCHNPILNPLNLFYKKVYIFFIEKIKKIKNIKSKDNFETQEDKSSSCKRLKYQKKNNQIRMF